MLNAGVALYSMLIVAGSGVIGRFLYMRVNRGLTGEKTSLKQLETRAGLAQSEARSKLHFAPEVEAMLQANIEAGYNRFLALVAKARGRTPEQIDAVAQGRVWDGGTARQKGLVDQFGGLDAALGWVAGQAHLEAGDWHAEFLGGDNRPFARLIDSLRHGDEEGEGAERSRASDFTGLVALRQRDALAGALARLDHLLGKAGAQAWCLECGALGPVPVRAVVPPRRWWASLLAPTAIP